MNVPAALILAGAAAMAVFTVAAVLMARAPGWRELKGFAVISGSASAYSFADVWTVLGASDEVLRRVGSLELSFGALHAAGWILFFAALERRGLGRLDRVLFALACAVLVVGLFPEATTAGASSHRVEWLDVTWHDTPPTALGSAVYAFFVGSLSIYGVRVARKWRAGARDMGTFAVGFAGMAVAASNDALVSMGVLAGPYLLNLGLFGLVAAAARLLMRRFVAAEGELRALSGELERQVGARTQEVTDAVQALARADKLGALGALAGGVAHEINNPAAVVLSNVEFLQAQGRAKDEALEALGDAIESTQRIGRIVSQLLKAGRVASGRHGMARTFEVRPSVERVVARLPAELAARAAFGLEVPAGLTAVGNAELFEEALGQVVRNAAQAVTRTYGAPGRVTVRAERAGAVVQVSVEDDGGGMSEATRRRLFEPFSTAREGSGAGLGLAVALGLLRAQGGDVHLRSSGPAGTRFVVELPAGEASR